MLLLVTSCSINHKIRGINQGEIKFKINYLQDASENPLIGLMPTELNMTFKENNVSMSVEGWMGIFKSSFIKMGNNGEVITLLKIMNKKFYCQSNSSGLLGVDSYKDLNIEFDDQTKEILNIKCQHATGTLNGKAGSFDIYYTTDIHIEEPNFNSPFEVIPGVLMEFQLEMDGIPMHLIAIKLSDIDIPDNAFDVPEEYQKISKDKMDEIFQSLHKSN